MTGRTIGRVAALWRYPVQSLRGETLDALTVTAKGPVGDRGYGIYDPAAGHTAIAARGKKPWRPLITWSARYLGDPQEGQTLPDVEIAFEDGTTLRSDAPDIDAKLHARLGWDAQFKRMVDTTPAYQHAPVHALTTATLDALRAHYPSGRFEPPRFRPNLVIETDPTLKGFVESAWLGRRLSAGEVDLTIDENTVRCILTTLPQGDLPQDAGILASITEANKQHAGVYCGVTNGGRVKIGDPVVLHDA